MFAFVGPGCCAVVPVTDRAVRTAAVCSAACDVEHGSVELVSVISGTPHTEAASPIRSTSLSPG